MATELQSHSASIVMLIETISESGNNRPLSGSRLCHPIKPALVTLRGAIRGFAEYENWSWPATRIPAGGAERLRRSTRLERAVDTMSPMPHRNISAMVKDLEELVQSTAVLLMSHARRARHSFMDQR
jgi:hypothetical protein